MRKTRPTLLVALVITALLSASSLQAQATSYTYRGNPFSAVRGPYSSSNFISGFVTLTSPIPLSSNGFFSNLVTYSFSDGVYTWDPTNSAPPSPFAFRSDAGGNIVDWTFHLIGNAGPMALGGILQSFGPGVSFFNPSTTAADEVGFDTINGPYFGENGNAPGLWTTAAPEPGSLLLVGTGIIGLGLAVRRKARNAA